MVDTLVSGASASRHVGSSPILGTKKEQFFNCSFFCARWATILINPPNLPLSSFSLLRLGYTNKICIALALIATLLREAINLLKHHLFANTCIVKLLFFFVPCGTDIDIPSKPPFSKRGYKSSWISFICKFLLTPFFFVPYGTDINISPVSYLSSFSLFKKQKILRHHPEFEQQELR